jgi:GT2 family glycosyltransferase
MNCLAILVNFHCAKLIVEAVESLIGDAECDWIHVVDNSEDEDEEAWLKQHLPSRAKLLVSQQNIGFARACNWALETVRPDTVLLLNPDARLLPGSLKRLKLTLAEHKNVGAVGPRVFWDKAQTFLLPPSTYPSRLDMMGDVLSRRWSWIGHRRADAFRRRSLTYWTVHKPLHVTALSGGHILLRFNALNTLGSLFDERFFMYWEDSDLMRRLADSGWQRMMEPRAEALHHYEHSVGKDQLLSLGWLPFSEKYFSTWFWKKLYQWAQAWPPSNGTEHLIEDVAMTEQGLTLQVPESLKSAWILEVSPSPDFVPAFGSFGCGSVARLPAKLAVCLKDRAYFMRLGNSSKAFGPIYRFKSATTYTSRPTED